MSLSASRKEVLSAIFRRRGANGRCTRLFEDMDNAVKEQMLGIVSLSIDELPIIGSFEAADRWFLLTTAKLVWRRDEKTSTLSIAEIVDASADLEALARKGLTKLSMRELQIETSNGKFVLDVEPGAPLAGVWSVLQNIGAGNRNLEANLDADSEQPTKREA